ncbi:hypothetical protein [Methylocella sp. CPCC 101449]|uniref:hypothetical protein n=1 Tax=Methylocella sp. CPCC 101449 TaxID=2987531 RepID=UPI0028921DF4|nr:hypothetical protein [Methylocella sp. CPCC 101449]MDT2022836.1 hypothetical protein [Methylocella sp. CPCC 101449]
MPNSTVPAAATGLPKSTRRRVIAGLAAAPALAAPAHAIPGDADAALLALYDRWCAARRSYAQVLYALGSAQEQMKAAGAIPDAAQFQNQPRRAIRTSADCGDDFWQELRDLANRSGPNGTYRFRPESYAEMAARVDINEWVPFDASEWIGGRILMQDSNWIAPYSPPLRARVREILQTYLPWKAEYDRLAAALGLDEKRAAVRAASKAEKNLALEISALHAATLDGLRAKATIAGCDYYDRETAVASLEEHIKAREEDAFMLSVIIDLADWNFISAEARILKGEQEGTS